MTVPYGEFAGLREAAKDVTASSFAPLRHPASPSTNCGSRVVQGIPSHRTAHQRSLWETPEGSAGKLPGRAAIGENLIDLELETAASKFEIGCEVFPRTFGISIRSFRIFPWRSKDRLRQRRFENEDIKSRLTIFFLNWQSENGGSRSKLDTGLLQNAVANRTSNGPISRNQYPSEVAKCWCLRISLRVRREGRRENRVLST